MKKHPPGAPSSQCAQLTDSSRLRFCLSALRLRLRPPVRSRSLFGAVPCSESLQKSRGGRQPRLLAPRETENGKGGRERCTHH